MPEALVYSLIVPVLKWLKYNHIKWLYFMCKMRKKADQQDLLVNAVLHEFYCLMRAIAVKNKESVYTICPALRIKIKVFNLFKRNLIVYICRIINTNNIAIGNCCF